MDKYNSKIVKIFYEVEVTKSTPTETDIECDTPESQREFYPDVINRYICSFNANNAPLDDDDLPDGVENAMHTLSFTEEHGISLCCSYRIQNDFFDDNQKLVDVLNKIVDDMDGALCDGWGESGMSVDCKGYTVYLHFRNYVDMVVMDVPCTCWLHAKWGSVDDIEHLDWIMNGSKVYNALFKPEVVNGTIKLKNEAAYNILKKFDGVIKDDVLKYKLVEELTSTYNADLDVYNYVTEHKDMFFTA